MYIQIVILLSNVRKNNANHVQNAKTGTFLMHNFYTCAFISKKTDRSKNGTCRVCTFTFDHFHFVNTGKGVPKMYTTITTVARKIQVREAGIGEIKSVWQMEKKTE